MSDELTPRILKRLSSIEGHVRGVSRMVEKGEYCIDVVNQILAVQRALQKVSSMVLDRHLHTCVATALKGDDPADRERVIEEIMNVFEARSR